MRTLTRIPELDGLRGVAIVLVLIWHYFVCEIGAPQSPWMNFLLRTPLILTWSGVDLFFVLSGFLIGGNLIDQRSSPSFFRTFYIRRSCRILPLYYLVILSFLVALLCGVSDKPRFQWLVKDPHPIWTYATFTQTFAVLATGNLGAPWLSVAWSLAIEEHFYLVLPLLVYWCPSGRLPYLVASLVLLAPALRLFTVFVFPGYAHANFLLMPCRADSLLVGVLAAWAVRVPGVVQHLKTGLNGLYWIFAVLSAGVAVIAYGQPPFASQLMSLFGYSWLAAFYVVLLLICLFEKKGLVSWICRNPLLRKIGIISYGVYLLHLVVSGLCHALIHDSMPKIVDSGTAATTLLSLVITLALAWFFYVFFEKPIIDFGHTYRYAKSESAGGVIAREATPSGEGDDKK